MASTVADSRTVESISLDKFSEAFISQTELSSVAIGGHIVSVSDEFFAEAFHLLMVEPAPSLKGQFGPKGALYSGWESRRHNPSYDWCIIRLGTSGTISGFDVDTSHFSGNEAPEVSVEALQGARNEEPQPNDPRWTEILPKVKLGPNSRHLFKIATSFCVNFVKLKMYPDGGIARFRVYGQVMPVWPLELSELFDMAHVFAGGRVEATSDQHFGVGSNLILPGRGKDMGDGWETRRSREVGHKDWVVIKLGAPGYLEQVEIDTAHFKGNFPESCILEALQENSGDWIVVLTRTKLGPHRQHFFQLENVDSKVFTHVRLTIYPDGGVKRVRVLGKRARGEVPRISAETTTGNFRDAGPSLLKGFAPEGSRVIPVLPLTPEAFANFGKVIQAYDDVNAVPRGTKVTSANGGNATKFHKLALLESSYPSEGKAARSGLSVYKCQPVQKDGNHFHLTVLERHRYTNQAFLPMASSQQKYLVVVAVNGSDDRPDLKTLRAFAATSTQGILYNTGIWHQPLTTLAEIPMDFACVETQIGDGSVADCEILELSDGVLLSLE